MGKIQLDTAIKAQAVRRKLNLAPSDTFCVFDAAEMLDLKVRFTDIPSLEGIYSKPNIVLSALRSYGRQVANCAHELGHHVYEHGPQVDMDSGSTEEDETYARKYQKDRNEFIAENFAVHFLMPKTAVNHAFVSREWNSAAPNEYQIYTVAKHLGVSYGGLIHHMQHTLRLLTPNMAHKLSVIPPKRIRSRMIGREFAGELIPVDYAWGKRPIDIQVGDWILVPHQVISTSACVSQVGLTIDGCLYQGDRPGVGEFYSTEKDWVTEVRVCRSQFVGLNKYRYLEDPEANG